MHFDLLALYLRPEILVIQNQSSSYKENGVLLSCKCSLNDRESELPTKCFLNCAAESGIHVLEGASRLFNFGGHLLESTHN